MKKLRERLIKKKAQVREKLEELRELDEKLEELRELITTSVYLSEL